MIFHSIRFTLKPTADPRQVEDTLNEMRRMGTDIDVVDSWVVGRDYGGEYTYGATYVVKDLDAYVVYLNHPQHLKVDRMGLELIDKMVSFDITDEPDTAIGDKIAAAHKERFEKHADLNQLIGGMGSYSGSGTAG